MVKTFPETVLAVESARLCIPHDRCALLLGRLFHEVEPRLRVDGLAPVQELEQEPPRLLSIWLETLGWVVQRQPEALVLTGNHCLLHHEEDLLLRHGVGLIQPGGFLRAWTPHHRPVEVRFFADRKQVVYGSLVFPYDPDWSPLLQRQVIVRPCQITDHLPRGLADGDRVLVALSQGKVVAWLEHQPHPQLPVVERIVRVGARPWGRKLGSLDALVNWMQQHYPGLLVTSARKPGWTRFWQRMGFVPFLNEHGTASPTCFFWSASPASSAQATVIALSTALEKRD